MLEMLLHTATLRRYRAWGQLIAGTKNCSVFCPWQVVQQQDFWRVELNVRGFGGTERLQFIEIPCCKTPEFVRAKAPYCYAVDG